MLSRIDLSFSLEIVVFLVTFAHPKIELMNHRREYDIAFVGLRPGNHVFEYRLDDKFFAPYGEQDFDNCTANVKLNLEKNSNFMQLKFDVDGSLDILCDRCGNTITRQLWDEFNIIVKVVENPDQMNEQEEDPDVYYISRGESHLHVSDWLYEFINLSIPMQNVCGEDAKGHSRCNQEVIEKLEKMKSEVKIENNPFIKGLENLKGLEDKN
jgi:uncharacterized metal-binding protein YceD (DUF177 family)